MYKILVSRKVLRSISKMPESIQMKLANLIEDLRDNGAIQTVWPNFSRIGKNEYHCHLSRKWVACWYWEKESIEIEVYNAGIRENAPY
jgi:mRNA-degrading endonuclease RelE of RelBE toxin-antitoxin system